MGPLQVPPLRIKVYLEVLAMKGTPHYSKLQNWNLIIRWFMSNSGHSLGLVYSSAGMQSAYFIAPAYWVSIDFFSNVVWVLRFYLYRTPFYWLILRTLILTEF